VSERSSRRKRPHQRPFRGHADLERLRSQTGNAIERLVPREYRHLPEDFWDDAVVVWPVKKEPVSIRLDRDVLSWFRESGPQYQSRINAVLRSYVARVQEQRAVGGPAAGRRRSARDGGKTARRPVT
jgi:uncharacterized protein (DUF4415 family)